MIRNGDSSDVMETETKGIKKKVNEFLGDSIAFIERKFFNFIKSGGISKSCDVEGVGD